MNNVDWDWTRIMMNKANWHWAAHCKNDLTDLGWEACDDLIEQKLLYAQHHTYEAWLQAFYRVNSRNADIFFERRIVVTECSTDNSRFSLVPKMNTEPPASQQSNVISEATLSTWGPTWGREPVSAHQRVPSEKPVSVYSSPLSALTCWAEQISILSWLWLHVWLVL